MDLNNLLSGLVGALIGVIISAILNWFLHRSIIKMNFRIDFIDKLQNIHHSLIFTLTKCVISGALYGLIGSDKDQQLDNNYESLVELSKFESFILNNNYILTKNEVEQLSVKNIKRGLRDIQNIAIKSRKGEEADKILRESISKIEINMELLSIAVGDVSERLLHNIGMKNISKWFVDRMRIKGATIFREVQDQVNKS